MDNYFQKTTKSWQTVLFFVILLGSAVFIGSVFGLGGYVAETDLLVVASNPQINRAYNYGDLGQTLKVVLREDAFHKLLQDKFSFDVPDKKIRVRHYKKTDVLKIKVRDKSVANTQKDIKNIYQAIVSYAPEYYTQSDKIIIKTLKAPQLVDSYTLAWQRGLEGAFAGLVVGLLVIWFTDFRLDLSLQGKSSRAIVRQKLRRELERSNFKKELEPEVEEYVFTSNGLLKNGQLEKLKKEKEKQSSKKQNQNALKKSNLTEVDQKNKRSNQDKITIKPQCITLNTFVDDDLKGRRQKEIIPDNLPVFVDEKYNKENELEQENSDNKSTEKVEEVSVDKSISKETENIIQKEERQVKEVAEKEDKKNIQQPQKVISSLEKPEAKIPSAHNIANGFTPPVIPDIPADEDLSPEEIKDRLNKLLRGDL